MQPNLDDIQRPRKQQPPHLLHISSWQTYGKAYFSNPKLTIAARITPTCLSGNLKLDPNSHPFDTLHLDILLKVSTVYTSQSLPIRTTDFCWLPWNQIDVLVRWNKECCKGSPFISYLILAHQVNNYLHWLKRQHLELSQHKSSVPLFSQSPRYKHPQRPIVNKNPKILGVTLDPLLTCNQHGTSVKNKL